MDEYSGIIRKERRDQKRRKRRKMRVNGRSLISVVLPAIVKRGKTLKDKEAG